MRKARCARGPGGGVCHSYTYIFAGPRSVPRARDEGMPKKKQELAEIVPGWVTRACVRSGDRVTLELCSPEDAGCKTEP